MSTTRRIRGRRCTISSATCSSPIRPVLDPHAAIGLMEAGSERTEAELVAAEVLAALREGVDPQEIVVVCRSLARSAELFERTLGALRAGDHQRSPGSARAHGAWAGAAGDRARYALLPGSQRQVEDLIAYLRHPGLVDSPETVDLFEREVRQQAGRTGSALRTVRSGPAPGDVGARAAAPCRRQPCRLPRLHAKVAGGTPPRRCSAASRPRAARCARGRNCVPDARGARSSSATSARPPPS